MVQQKLLNFSSPIEEVLEVCIQLLQERNFDRIINITYPRLWQGPETGCIYLDQEEFREKPRWAIQNNHCFLISRNETTELHYIERSNPIFSSFAFLLRIYFPKAFKRWMKPYHGSYTQ